MWIIRIEWDACVRDDGNTSHVLNLKGSGPADPSPDGFASLVLLFSHPWEIVEHPFITQGANEGTLQVRDSTVVIPPEWLLYAIDGTEPVKVSFPDRSAVRLSKVRGNCGSVDMKLGVRGGMVCPTTFCWHLPECGPYSRPREWLIRANEWFASKIGTEWCHYNITPQQMIPTITAEGRGAAVTYELSSFSLDGFVAMAFDFEPNTPSVPLSSVLSWIKLLLGLLK